jgi:hypothetical protein
MNHLPTFHAGEFRKATRSSPNQNCVRIARKLGWAVMWDDKLSDAQTTEDTLVSSTELLYFTDDQFDAYQTRLREGRIDGSCLSVNRREDDLYVFRAMVPQPVDGVQLLFNQDEVDAFFGGVHRHEFDSVNYVSA